MTILGPNPFPPQKCNHQNCLHEVNLMGTHNIRFNLKNKGKGTFYYIEILSVLVKVWSIGHKKSYLEKPDFYI